MDVQVSRLVRQLRAGSQTGQVLCDRLEMSRPTLSRLMEVCRRAHPGFLCQIGAARSTRYAWAKAIDPVTGMDPVTGLEEAVNQPWNITVHHVNRQGALQVMGTLTVLEADEYLFEYENDEALTRRFPNGWIPALIHHLSQHPAPCPAPPNAPLAPPLMALVFMLIAEMAPNGAKDLTPGF